MNRPFHAIGVLLTFLALAMLAVGSASRPRAKATASVELSAVQSPALQPDQVPIAQSARGGIYVLVLPSGDEFVIGESLVPIDLPTFALGCGLDRTTGEIYPQPDVDADATVESHPELATTVTFVPVTICAASEMTLPMSEIELDCPSTENLPDAPSERFADPMDEADCLKQILELMGEDVASAG